MPLLNPANYMLQLPDPAEAARKNLELGLGLMGAQQTAQQAQQRNQIFAAQQNKQAEEQSFNEAFAALSLNPSAVEVKTLMRRFPSHASSLKMEWDKLDQEERRARVAPLSRAYAAFLNKEPEIALNGLKDLATAYTNSGRAKDAASVQQIIDLGKSNAGGAAALIASSLAVEGDDKFVERFGKFTTLADEKRKAAGDADLAVTTADVANQTALKKAQVDIAQGEAAAVASRAGADASRAAADKSRSEIGKLPDDVQKDYVAAVKGIKSDRDKLSDLGDLAKNLETSATEGTWVDRGAAGWVNEKLKDAAGWQDKMSRLNQRYLALVSEDIKARQKPGDQMTEGDFKVAMQAYPSVNANPALKAQTVRDMEENRQAGLQMKIATAEFLTNNGSFNPASKPFTVQGIPVKPGDTFDSVVTALAAKSGIPVPTSAAPSGALTPEQARAKIAQNNARIAALRQGGK